MKKVIILVIVFIVILVLSLIKISSGQTYEAPSHVCITNDGINCVNQTSVGGSYAIDVNVTQSVVGGTGGMSNTAQVLVGNTVTLIRASNASRLSLIIRNQGSVDEWIGNSGVTIGNGILLHVNDVIMLDRNTAAWYGITSNGTTTTAWLEE